MKDQIIEVSLQQFLKYGIRKMTVQKLVAPLGISTKTVYKHFTDKEDLLKHCLNLHYKKLANELPVFVDAVPEAVVLLFKIWYSAIRMDFGVNHIFYHDLNYYYPQLQDAVVEKHLKKNSSWFGQLIAGCIQQGYVRDDINPSVAAESLRALYTSVTRTTNYRKFKLTPESLMQNTLEVFLRGMCTDKGLQTVAQHYQTILQ